MPLFPLDEPGLIEYERDIPAGDEIFEAKLVQIIEAADNIEQVRKFLTERLLEPIEIPDSPRYFIVQNLGTQWC